MLKSWMVSNFKSIYSMEQPLEFAPLTIFCGANSSGKSSVLQSILLLKQTLLTESEYPCIILRGNFVRLGNFDEIVSASKQSNKVDDKKIVIEFTLDKYEHIYEDRRGNKKNIDINLNNDTPAVSVKSKIEFGAGDESSEYNPKFGYISITDLNCKESKITVRCNKDDQYELIGKAEFIYPHSDIDRSLLDIPTDIPTNGFSGRKFLDENFKCFLPEVKFNKNELAENYKKNKKIIRDFFSKKLYYIGPLRADPRKRTDNIRPPGDTGVGCQGEYTAECYSFKKNRNIAWLCENCLNNNKFDIKAFMKDLEYYVPSDDDGLSLSDSVFQWLQYLDVANQINVDKEGNLTVRQGERDIGLNNVGVGVSQVLPIIVQCLVAEPGSTIIIEQPELHLHPKMQSRLSDFFLTMSLTGRQLIIETHSEYIIDKLRLRIVQAPLDKPINKKAAIYFVEKHNGLSEFKRIDINEFSVMSEWPEGFFEESINIAEDIFHEARRKDQERRRNNNDPQTDLDDEDYDD